MAKYSHLSNEDRSHIEAGLDNRQSFKELGEKVGKDCSTISKEVRSHMVFRKTGAYGRPFNDCVRRKTCQFSGVCDVCPEGKARTRFCSACGKCTDHCIMYEKEKCPRLAKPPYVCNGCPDKRYCTLEKCIYDAAAAQTEYSEVLSETRQGFAVSEEEKKRLDDIISPLIRKGQSLHHICLNHMDELMVTERTLYTYMDAGLFTARNIDMPRKVRMKPRRKRPDTIRVDPKCREGRTLQDYEKYRKEHPDTPVAQLDSVEGVKGGAVMPRSPFRPRGCSWLSDAITTMRSQLLTSLTTFILSLARTRLLHCFRYCWQTTAASFPIRRASNSTPKRTVATACFTVTLLLLIRREAVRCITK